MQQPSTLFVPTRTQAPRSVLLGLGMSDLIAWLDGWGLKQLGPRLAEQDIDLDALMYLTEDDLKELGLTIGLRRRRSRKVCAGLPRSWCRLPLVGPHRARTEAPNGGN